MSYDFGPEIGPDVDVWIERHECSLDFALRMMEKGKCPAELAVPGQDCDCAPLPETVAELEKLKQQASCYFDDQVRQEEADAEDKTDAADRQVYISAGYGRVAVFKGDEDELVSLGVGWGGGFKPILVPVVVIGE